MKWPNKRFIKELNKDVMVGSLVLFVSNIPYMKYKSMFYFGIGTPTHNRTSYLHGYG